MKVKGKPLAFLLAGVMVVVGVITYLRSQEQELSLLSRAVRATSTQGWGHAGYGQAPTIYIWLSDHELLHFIGSPNYSTTISDALQLDLQFGVEKPVPVMMLAMGGHDFQISPDYKWLSWETSVPHGSGAKAVRLDGTESLEWPKRWAGASMVSMPNSRQWASLCPSSPGPFLDVFTPGHPTSREVPLPKNPRTGDLLGFNSAGHAIISSEWSRFSTTDTPLGLQLSEWNVTDTAQLIRTWIVALPTKEPATEVRVALSPDGKRLLWCLSGLADHLRRSTRRIGVGRFQMSFGSGEGDPHHLWVCNVDGSHLQDLGGITDRLSQDHRSYARFEAPPVWMPDNRQISFVYDQSLWRVAVP